MSRPRKCRNKEAHAPHEWRGLNTRGEGYVCPGVVVRQVIDLMQALKDSLAARASTPEQRPE